MRAVPPPMITGALCRTACPSLETFAMPPRASPPRESSARGGHASVNRAAAANAGGLCASDRRRNMRRGRSNGLFFPTRACAGCRHG
ncbi:hypothetical protein AQ808_27715 [Burkholderia pseudomallei]|nr:hypothetical protein AQ748_05975 [Burkholderia pseudomallei]OMV00876.1 hypothetical protein AQ784_03845 [Burkholderia pseudomallei]OMV04608.1 hypothetical protein AQ785_30630 [Burkholderia pseudomallei]OMW42917.1 hypothetical protein AQ808_27715 [Burkholderia pseudomallei]OMW58168.1 hypothetical protein AQ812_10105 [Burkholderia pseudomallei]